MAVPPYERGCRLASTELRSYFLAVKLFVSFGLDHFAAAIVTTWADVMTQMRFTRGRLYSQRRVAQKIMRAMHSALGW